MKLWFSVLLVANLLTEMFSECECHATGQPVVMGKSIRIDSHCRIVIKNFDSVPQLQRFSYVHHCAVRSHHGSHSRQCRHSLLYSQLAALLQCGPAGHCFGGVVQQLQDQSPEPLVWTVEGGSDTAVNRI